MYDAPTLPDMTDRIRVAYTCPLHHEFALVFSADVQPPRTWDCPHCGTMGSADSATAMPAPVNTTRTHWEILRERRSLDELSAALTARLKVLRAK